jgi:predicted DNA-binding transcriptional regulator
MIQEILKKIGFNDKEVEIYLEALRLGHSTPTRIAKNTGINRTTVYSVAKNLIQKGVLTEDIGQKYIYLIALPPEQLSSMLEKKKRKLKEEEKLINQAIDELTNLPSNKQYSVPKIRFIEESNLEEYFYKRTDEWNVSMQQYDSSWWGFQDHSIVLHYEKWITEYWTKFKSSEKMISRLFTNQSEIENKMESKALPKRQMRFLKNSKAFTSTQWICGDYIVMVYTQNRPFYLIEIYNPVMSHNLREVFKNLWEEIKKK